MSSWADMATTENGFTAVVTEKKEAELDMPYGMTPKSFEKLFNSFSITFTNKLRNPNEVTYRNLVNPASNAGMVFPVIELPKFDDDDAIIPGTSGVDRFFASHPVAGVTVDGAGKRHHHVEHQLAALFIHGYDAKPAFDVKLADLQSYLPKKAPLVEQMQNALESLQCKHRGSRFELVINRLSVAVVIKCPVEGDSPLAKSVKAEAPVKPVKAEVSSEWVKLFKPAAPAAQATTAPAAQATTAQAEQKAKAFNSVKLRLILSTLAPFVHLSVQQLEEMEASGLIPPMLLKLLIE